MKLDILGIAVVGIGGFLLYSTLNKRAVEQEAAILDAPPPLDPEAAVVAYEAAGKTWEELLAGEPAEGGAQLFHPLDVSEDNPLRMYYAVVKKQIFTPSAGAPTPLEVMQHGAPTVGVVYLFNTLTKREVPLYELAKASSMTPEARKGVEETFANALMYACRIFSRYLPWENNLTMRSVDCNALYGSYVSL